GPVLAPRGLAWILQARGNRGRGFLGRGNVCTVRGPQEYEPLATRFAVPIVISGFEPIDLLDGVLRVVRQLEAGAHTVENQYARVARREGNPLARAHVDEVFEVCDRAWRGFGTIPKSGLRLGPEYRAFHA